MSQQEQGTTRGDPGLVVRLDGGPGSRPDRRHAGRLSGEASARPRGHGRGLPRDPDQPEPPGGAEGPAPQAAVQARLSCSVRGRGDGGLPSSTIRTSFTFTPSVTVRPGSLHRHGVCRGDEPARVHHRERGPRPSPGPLDHAAGRARPSARPARSGLSTATSSPRTSC